MLLEVDLQGRQVGRPYLEWLHPLTKQANKQQMKAEDLYDSSGGVVVLEEECVLEEEILIVL